MHFCPTHRLRQKLLQTDSLFCGKATAVASVHRTLAKSRLSNPPSKYPYQTKNTSRLGWCFGLAVLNLMYNLKQTVYPDACV